jgi:endonuclease/exonuclease/phosphatase family metal-dependent hydrolase
MKLRTSSAHALVWALVASAAVLTQVGMGRAGDSSPSICAPSVLARWPESSGPFTPSPGDPGLRVVSYNIHSGLGSTFSLGESRQTVERNLHEIIGAIVAAAPAGEPVDVVALNEVDFGSRRSAWIDEAVFLADELRTRTGHPYEVVRGQTWERRSYGREVKFGNALLVRLPILRSSSCLFRSGECEGAPINDELPGLRPAGLRGLMTEERGVIKTTVLAGSKPIDLIVTHLDAFSAEAREAQAMHLLHRFVDRERTTILLGDLNAVTTSLTGGRRFFRGERTLDVLTSSTLADARTTYAALHGLDSFDRWATYPADAPAWPLDAVLASADLLPAEVNVIGSTASDHRGIAARLIPVDEAEALAGQQARHNLIRSAQLERIRRCDLASEEARLQRGWLIEKTGFAALESPAS